MNARNSLVTYLLNFAMSHDIGYDLVPCGKDFTSKALPESRRIIINTDWANQDEIPFIIAHEIGHIMNGDTGIRYYDSGTINSKLVIRPHRMVALFLKTRLVQCSVVPMVICRQHGQRTAGRSPDTGIPQLLGTMAPLVTIKI